MSQETKKDYDEQRARITLAKEKKLRQISEAQYQGILDAVLSRKNMIVELDMYEIEKLSQLFPKALSVNGCCTG